MARNRSRRTKFSIPSKYLLLFLSIVCSLMMILSYNTTLLSGPLETVAGYTIIPFQRGLSYVGSYFSIKSDTSKSIEELTKENEELKAKVDELTLEVNELTSDKYELSELRQLMALSDKYSEYPTVGARVIGKDAGNWYSTFLIDKGEKDGLEIDMNVMAGTGLVGIITEVGPNWATVKSIINDSSNISAVVLNSEDPMIVSGDLELYSKGYINFSELHDQENKVSSGDQIVTSNISNKYLPGILIGFISEINPDSNQLTKSGYITPVVDFEHLNTVLVIKSKKQTKE